MTHHDITEFPFGRGKISGTLSVVLSILSLGGILCFYFPEFLTTPELRAIYPIPFLRKVLSSFIFLAFVLGIISLVLNERKIAGLTGIGLSLLATALGGSGVQIPETVVSQHSIGLDWFILDLLILGLVFVPLERFFCRLKEQRIFRSGWQTDLWHFFFSHLLVQVTALLILAPALVFSKYLANAELQSLVRLQPPWLQFLEIVIMADFTQYWVHRMFHSVPILWRFHAIHHSSEEMDWLAGSRLHLLDIVVTRGLTLVPLFYLGFEQSALHAYLLFVAFLATFIHANIRFQFLPLHRVIATPAFHHWHHAAEKKAADKNFAVHLPLLDILFGTYYLPHRCWPARYGLNEGKIPKNYLGQLIYPFSQWQAK